MLDIKHTPLPWVQYAYGTQIYGGTNLFIAAVQSANDIPDAGFIVRACNSHYELLEALEGALALAGTDSPLWDQARAAVLKAKGEGIYTKKQYDDAVKAGESIVGILRKIYES